MVSALQAAIEHRQRLYIVKPFTPETVRLALLEQSLMPEEGIILYLRPLRPARFLLVRRSFHKFYFRLEERFARISHQVSILDPWLKSEQIQRLLTYLLFRANKFILTIDEWTEEKLLEKWMKKDADRLWESVVRYVYRKRGLKV